MTERVHLLEMLVRLNAPLPGIARSLAALPWDSDEELVTLTRADLAAVLGRYVASELTAQTVEDWANAIEGREDIGYEAAYEGIIQEAIHELANPLLTEPLTLHTAQIWISRLGT